MEFPDYKALKKLADACRKAGIKTFKGDGIEFTLTDEAPVSQYKQTKRATAVPANLIEDAFTSDSLPEDALLFWSAGPSTDETPTE